jgi:hypothetical protein
MNAIKTIPGSGLVLMLTCSAPIAWGQSVSKIVAASGSAEFTRDSASLMDQNVSREIKQAWSEGKNATLAMSFQENGEIAMGQGKEGKPKSIFRLLNGNSERSSPRIPATPAISLK